MVWSQLPEFVKDYWQPRCEALRGSVARVCDAVEGLAHSGPQQRLAALEALGDVFGSCASASASASASATVEAQRMVGGLLLARLADKEQAVRRAAAKMLGALGPAVHALHAERLATLLDGGASPPCERAGTREAARWRPPVSGSCLRYCRIY